MASRDFFERPRWKQVNVNANEEISLKFSRVIFAKMLARQGLLIQILWKRLSTQTLHSSQQEIIALICMIFSLSLSPLSPHPSPTPSFSLYLTPLFRTLSYTFFYGTCWQMNIHSRWNFWANHVSCHFDCLYLSTLIFNCQNFVLIHPCAIGRNDIFFVVFVVFSCKINSYDKLCLKDWQFVNSHSHM